MRSLLLLPCLLLFSCSAPDAGLHADLGKLRPWSGDLPSVQPLPPPFVADFELGSRALCYAAIEPSSEKESPSLSLLHQVMNNRRYGIVVLEGIPRSMGINPGGEVGKSAREGIVRSGETSAAIAQAQAKKIPFVGAEPDEDLIKRAVVGAGYSVQDLFGLYVLRLVPQWRLDGTLTRETFEEAYEQARPVLGARLGLTAQQAPSLGDFQRWYESRHGTSFQLSDIHADTAAPVPEGALFSQKVAAVTDRVRSEHILRVTEEMLNRYGRVLLVFQSAHFPVQEPALESMLGKPTRISDQP